MRARLSGAEGRWRQRLDRWRQSGLSITAFCKREGVSLPSFFQWRKRLQGDGRRRPAFVPVEVVADGQGGCSDAALGGPALGNDSRIEIHCGSLVLRVPPRVDEQSLRQVLRVAREETARC